VKGEAMRAKSEVHEVITDLSHVERGRAERSVPMETRVEDITPVLDMSQYSFHLSSYSTLQDSTNVEKTARRSVHSLVAE
jgi:hypothetical protein